MDYLSFLHDALEQSKENTNTQDLIVRIWDERDFEHNVGKLAPVEKTINIIVKALPTTISYYTKDEPYELTIWSEANDIQETQAMLIDFVNTNNYLQQVEVVDGKKNIYKHSYSSPMMLDPFQDQGTMVRAMFMVSANVVEIENVADVSSYLGNYGYITIDGIEYPLVSFSMAYVSNPNTRMTGNGEIARTISDGSVLNLTIGFPAVSNSLTLKVLRQSSGNISGDSIYLIEFKIGGIDFSGEFRLTSQGFSTSPDGAPSIVLGFTL